MSLLGQYYTSFVWLSWMYFIFMTVSILTFFQSLLFFVFVLTQLYICGIKVFDLQVSGIRSVRDLVVVVGRRLSLKLQLWQKMSLITRPPKWLPTRISCELHTTKTYHLKKCRDSCTFKIMSNVYEILRVFLKFLPG